MEVALSRFDGEMEVLELNLAEQRKVMMRMLDSMRSDAFEAVKDFLVSRQEALTALASSGSTDPAEIGRSVQQLRRALEPLAADSPQVRSVLDRVDQADKHLASASPATKPRALAPSATARREQAGAGDEEATA
ncbi:MAG: hypothetical protein EXR65_04975 [Dehalococcoidia bacterium]|nr:hypothetical protein [Dehalococcoidia bacterium]